VFVRSVEVQRELILFLEPFHVTLALRCLRLEYGMTQRELSRLTSFSTATISMREGERYKSFPSMSTIEYYCEAFGISVYSFVFEVFWQADSSLSFSIRKRRQTLGPLHLLMVFVQDRFKTVACFTLEKSNSLSLTASQTWPPYTPFCP